MSFFRKTSTYNHILCAIISKNINVVYARAHTHTHTHTHTYIYIYIYYIYIQSVEAKYRISLISFFRLIRPILEKKRNKSKFSWLALLFKPFFIKMLPSMSEQIKKRQRIYHLLNVEIKPKIFFEIIPFSLWHPSNPDLKPLDNAKCGVLDNKTNETSHPNIGLLKTAIEEAWNKMSKKLILKSCKSFQSRVDTIIEKKYDDHIQWIYCFMFIFLFCLFLK